MTKHQKSDTSIPRLLRTACLQSRSLPTAERSARSGLQRLLDFLQLQCCLWIVDDLCVDNVALTIDHKHGRLAQEPERPAPYLEAFVRTAIRIGQNRVGEVKSSLIVLRLTRLAGPDGDDVGAQCLQVQIRPA
jgi:hypothetical protein